MLTDYELKAIQPRDLYWCEPDPEDTVGGEQEKDRLWVVLSRNNLQRGNCVVAIPLTSKTHKACAHLLLIPKSEIRMIDGHEAIDSVALTDQIRALDKSRFRKKGGSVTQGALTSMLAGLDYLFGR